jgi:hypothetical protein
VEGQYDATYVERLLKRHREVLLESCEFTDLGGVDKLQSEPSESDMLALAIKSERRVVAVVCDADEAIGKRWPIIKKACSQRGLQLPEDLPASGLLIPGDQGRRFGCWVMPNNLMPGAIETLMLSSIEGDDQVSLLGQARNFVESAKPRKFPSTVAAKDKATLRAWMAVQEKAQWVPSAAIEFRKLFPEEKTAKPFLDWLEQLTKL